MIKLITKFFTELINERLDDKLYTVVIFYVDNKVVDTRNMFVVPRVGDEIYIETSLYGVSDVYFKCEKVRIISKLGYEIRVYGHII